MLELDIVLPDAIDDGVCVSNNDGSNASNDCICCNCSVGFISEANIGFRTSFEEDD